VRKRKPLPLGAQRITPLPAHTVAEGLFRSLSTVSTGRRSGAHAGWIWDAVETIKTLAGELRELTVEDLRDRMPDPDNASMAGLAFREAARLGYVENSGRVQKSRYRDEAVTPRCRPLTVWESLL
jgi:hypothetical protein